MFYMQNNQTVNHQANVHNLHTRSHLGYCIFGTVIYRLSHIIIALWRFARLPWGLLKIFVALRSHCEEPPNTQLNWKRIVFCLVNNVWRDTYWFWRNAQSPCYTELGCRLGHDVYLWSYCTVVVYHFACLMHGFAQKAAGHASGVCYETYALNTPIIPCSYLALTPVWKQEDLSVCISTPMVSWCSIQAVSNWFSVAVKSQLSTEW